MSIEEYFWNGNKTKKCILIQMQKKEEKEHLLSTQLLLQQQLLQHLKQIDNIKEAVLSLFATIFRQVKQKIHYHAEHVERFIQIIQHAF